MSAPRIFVSYDLKSSQDLQLANSLFDYCRRQGYEAVTSGRALFDEQLPSSNWAIIIRTPASVRNMSMNDSNVSKEIDFALRLYNSRRLQGVFCVATPTNSRDIPPQFSTLTTYEVGAQGQEQQAFDDVLRTINYTKPIAKSGPPVNGIAINSRSNPQNQAPLANGNGMSTLPVRQQRSPLRIIVTGVVVLALLGVLFYTFNPFQLGAHHNQVVSNKTPVVSHTATPTPSPTPNTVTLYQQSTKGTPVVTLADKAHDGSSTWDNNAATCTLNTDGTYTATISAKGLQACMNKPSASASNFAYQAQVNIKVGDVGGLILISGNATDPSYRFSVSTDGNYTLVNCTQCTQLSDNSITTAPAPSSSANTPFILTVIDKKGTLYFYIGKSFITSVNDPNFQLSQIGVFAASRSGQNTMAIFSSVKLWTLQ